MNRTVSRNHETSSLFAALLVAAAFAATSARATAAEPLGCQAAKLSAQVNHARCSVRCTQRPPERMQTCQARCDERLNRRITILGNSPICTGQVGSPVANNGVCDLQLLKSAWKQVKCFLRCERLAEHSDTFDLARCNGRCQSQFDRSKARVLGQPICRDHSGQMPLVN